ncbi:MAG: hypothetical protein LBH04_12570 [Tannerellaceae bacterium]|nr:hypothetical protein [Tannerellaceae bacterium]
MKRINIMTGALLVYLLVMGVIGWPGGKAEPDYGHYSLIILATLAAIFLLRFVQVYRLKSREKRKKEEGEG